MSVNSFKTVTPATGTGMSIDRFETELATVIGNPTGLRPFVCNGSPLTCRVFIVGLNPASPMKADFWDFWQPGIGFDKQSWMQTYVTERAQRPLKPGRTRRRKVSATRAAIEWIIDELGPNDCLETNIYAKATEEYASLTPAGRITAPFDYLLETIKPQVLIVHGKDAIAHIKGKSIDAHVIDESHLGRGWSQEKARALGRDVLQLLK